MATVANLSLYTSPPWQLPFRGGALTDGSSTGDANGTREVTALLVAWEVGDPEALERLLPLVYDELRRIGERQLRGERAGQTLQPTAIVHEAYLRLVDQSRANWQNRSQFYAVAARMMRRVLVDHARHRDRVKRGAGSPRISLDECLDEADAQIAEQPTPSEASSRSSTTLSTPVRPRWWTSAATPSPGVATRRSTRAWRTPC